MPTDTIFSSHLSQVDKHFWFSCERSLVIESQGLSDYLQIKLGKEFGNGREGKWFLAPNSERKNREYLSRKWVRMDCTRTNTLPEQGSSLPTAFRTRSVCNCLSVTMGGDAEMRDYRWRPDPGEDLWSLLGKALIDTYVRHGSKAARNYPRKKNEKPAGKPLILSAAVDLPILCTTKSGPAPVPSPWETSTVTAIQTLQWPTSDLATCRFS